ncbi:MAG: DnaJ domain-containing protein [Thermonemataceae bacterium]
MKDFYQILGVTSKATPLDIRKAYKRLTLLYHPDRNTNNPEAIIIFKRITEAYRVLSDQQKRAAYDYQRGFRNVNPATSSPTQADLYKEYQAAYRQYQEERKTVARDNRRYSLLILLSFIIIFMLSYFFKNFMDHQVAKSDYEKALKAYEQREYLDAKQYVDNAIVKRKSAGKFYILRAKIELYYFRNSKEAWASLELADQYQSVDILGELYYYQAVCLFAQDQFVKSYQKIDLAARYGYRIEDVYYLRAICAVQLQIEDAQICEDLHHAFTLGKRPAQALFYKYCY